MKKTMLAIVAVLVISSGLAFAQCGSAAKAGMGGVEKMEASNPQTAEAGDSQKSEVSSDAVVNTVCPVMGQPVSKDTPYTIVYAGKKIGFCCAACLESFKQNPEEYIDKLEDAGQ